MTTPHMMNQLNRMSGIIQKEGRLSKVQLCLLAHISPYTYDKLKPFLVEMPQYVNLVRYDPDDRVWLVVKSDKVLSPNIASDM